MNAEEYIQNLKDRVILFPEENIKLEILKKNQTASEDTEDITEDMLTEPENEPHLKDIFNTSHSRQRRRAQRVSYRVDFLVHVKMFKIILFLFVCE